LLNLGPATVSQGNFVQLVLFQFVGVTLPALAFQLQGQFELLGLALLKVA
jgi:hypothetical protein